MGAFQNSLKSIKLFITWTCTVHSRTYCDRCPTSDMSDLTCQTRGRMETGAIKRVIKLES